MNLKNIKNILLNYVYKRKLISKKNTYLLTYNQNKIILN